MVPSNLRPTNHNGLRCHALAGSNRWDFARYNRNEPVGGNLFNLEVAMMYRTDDPVIKKIVTAIFTAERYNETTPEAVLCKALNVAYDNGRLNGITKPKLIELED